MVAWVMALFLSQLASIQPPTRVESASSAQPPALAESSKRSADQKENQSAGQRLAQTAPEPVEEVVEQPVRPLPGELDRIPVFNSNSPELVGEPGILLSTFPPAGMAVPEAHLNFPLQGRFDVFAHHVYKVEPPAALDSLYLAVLMHNPSDVPVTVRVLTAASYLSQPDAPFISLPAFVPFGRRNPVFAGPGSRVMGDFLQARRQEIFPASVTIPPGESQLLMNQPIPVRELEPPINGRSTLVQLESSGPVYVASLAQPAAIDDAGNEAPPTLEAWRSLLETGGLAGPRDRAPSPIPLPEGEQLIYGRVAGVSEGTLWEATLSDPPTASPTESSASEPLPGEPAGGADTTAAPQLTIPAAGEAFSYGISLLYAGTLGTGQNQTAPMLVRYPDTAYQAHGNYGIRYSLTLPLYNPTDAPQQVSVTLQTALKEEQLSQGGLRFLEPPAPQTFFRGPVQVRYRSDSGLPQVRNIHLVQRRGQQGDPLVTLTLAPQSTRTVRVDLLYPPDSTPPQVLTVQTAPDD